jgi:hypothetical protein
VGLDQREGTTERAQGDDHLRRTTPPPGHIGLLREAAKLGQQDI